MEAGSHTPNDKSHYLALADRARSILRAAGRALPERELATALFGATAKGPLFVRLLEQILGGDDRFARTGDAAWGLAGPAAGAIPLSQVDFVVLDLEVTGFRPSRHRILEVAAIRLGRREADEAVVALLNPERRVPAYLLDLMGLAASDLAEAPSFAEVAGRLRSFLGSAVLVGHGLGTGLEYLRQELRRLNQPPPANEVIDTLALARRLLPGDVKPNLEAIAAQLGLRAGRRHRALMDARLVREVFLHLLDLARARGVGTLAGLRELAAPRLGEDERPTLLDASLLATIPHRSGVYVLRDVNGQAVYVGKATDLHERVSSYFSRPPAYVRQMEGLVEAVAEVEPIPLGSELEARLVEARMIRQLRPIYNVQVRSRRQPAYLVIDPAAPFPRWQLRSEPGAAEAKTYGPWPNGRAARQALRELQNIFPLRTCARKMGRPKRGRRARQGPCLRGQTGRCLAPCQDAVGTEEYAALVEESLRFLAGERGPTIARLQTDLAAATSAGDRERAGALTGLLRLAHRFPEPPIWAGQPDGEHALVVARPSLGDEEVELFLVERGRLLGQVRVSPKNLEVSRLVGALRELRAEAPQAGAGEDGTIISRWLEEHPGEALALSTLEGDRQAFAAELLARARDLLNDL